MAACEGGRGGEGRECLVWWVKFYWKVLGKRVGGCVLDRARKDMVMVCYENVAVGLGRRIKIY